MMGNFPRSSSSNWVVTGLFLARRSVGGRIREKGTMRRREEERHRMRRRWSGPSQIRWTSEVALVIYVVLVSYRGGDSRDFPQSLVIAPGPIRQLFPGLHRLLCWDERKWHVLFTLIIMIIAARSVATAIHNSPASYCASVANLVSRLFWIYRFWYKLHTLCKPAVFQEFALARVVIPPQSRLFPSSCRRIQDCSASGAPARYVPCILQACPSCIILI